MKVNKEKPILANIQAKVKQNMERILQCNACQSNLFHLIKLGKKQIIECSGCKSKTEMKK
jgi:hypothetical protein